MNKSLFFSYKAYGKLLFLNSSQMNDYEPKKHVNIGMTFIVGSS